MSKKIGEKGEITIDAFSDDIDDRVESASIHDRLEALKSKNKKKVEESVKENSLTRENLNKTFKNDGIIEHHNFEFPEKKEILKEIENNISELIDLDFIPKEERDQAQVEKADDILEDIIIATKGAELEPEKFESLDIKNKVFEDDEFVEYLLGHLLRFLQPETIKKEVYDKSKKNYISRNILGTPDLYADFRYMYINEKYKQIFNSIPKNFKNRYTEGYLREAFIILNVIFGHVPDADGLDDRTVADIIVKHNDILPANVMYQKPYTIQFFMDLSKYGVYNKIRRVVNDKIVLDQIQSLMRITSMKLEMLKTMGEESVETKDLKDLSMVMTTISNKYKELAQSDDETTISYVFNDAQEGLDYSGLVDFEVIEPDSYVEFDFKYYIKAMKKEGDTTKFDGYIYLDQIKNGYYISKNKVEVWNIGKGDDTKLGEFQKIVNTLKKKYITHELKIVKKVSKQEAIL